MTLELALLMFVAAALLWGRNSHAKRLQRIEQKLDLLIQKAGIEDPYGLEFESVKRLVRRGRLSEATTLYSRIAGTDASAARAAVARMAAETTSPRA